MIRATLCPAVLLALGVGLPAPAWAQSQKEVNTQEAREAGKAADGPELGRAETLVTTLTNRFRAEEGLGKLTPDKALAEAARYFARYLAENEEFSHTADGQQPAERAAKHGYEYCIVLENLAYQSDPSGFSTGGLARKFVEGWKDSPGHRKNLLDPDVTETGVAVVRGEEGRYYAVQMFGRPRSASIAFEVANRADSAVAYRVAGERYELPPRYTRSHKVCRPPKLEFLGPADREDADVVETVRPGDGERLIVREGGKGGVEIVKEEE